MVDGGFSQNPPFAAGACQNLEATPRTQPIVPLPVSNGGSANHRVAALVSLVAARGNPDYAKVRSIICGARTFSLCSLKLQAHVLSLFAYSRPLASCLSAYDRRLRSLFFKFVAFLVHLFQDVETRLRSRCHGGGKGRRERQGRNGHRSGGYGPYWEDARAEAKFPTYICPWFHSGAHVYLGGHSIVRRGLSNGPCQLLTLCSTASYILPNGGLAGMVWMYVVTLFGFSLAILSMAEMASMAPTAGGQYHWVSEFAPRGGQKFLSYIAGWLCVLGWQVNICSGSYLVATQVQGILLLNLDGYTAPAWHATLMIIAVATLCIIFNTFFARKLPLIEGLILIIHVFGFFAILIPLWALSERQPAKVGTEGYQGSHTPNNATVIYLRHTLTVVPSLG